MAVPALANIYKSLRKISTSKDPGSYTGCVPCHFINGWLNMYWPGLYIPAASEVFRGRLPHLIEIAGASYSAFDLMMPKSKMKNKNL